MKKKNVITVGFMLLTGLVFAFSSDYNSTGMQMGTDAGKGASIAQQTGMEPAAGISNTGNAPGVYEFRNKVVPTVGTTQATAAAAVKNAGEIVVTARRLPEEIALVPRSVEVIKASEIVDSTEKNLKDILNSIAGTVVLSNGGYQGAASIAFRGAPSKHTLVLLDGVPLNDILVGGVDLSLIGLNSVDRIEIVKGGVSSVYGADAAAGVINIITGTKEEKPLSISASYGSFNTQKYSLSSDYKVLGVNYSVCAVEEKSDGYTENSGYLKHVLNAKLSFTGDALDSTVYGYYVNREMGTPYDGFGGLSNATQWDENYSIGLDEQFTVGAVKGKLSGYMRSGQIRILNPAYSSYSNHKKKEYSGSFYMIYDEGGYFSGMTGYDAGLKEVDSTNIGNTTNANHASVTNISVKMLDDKLIINTGFRADFNSGYGNMTSENLSIKYRFPENVDVRASFDKSFSAPTLGDLYWPEEDFGYSFWNMKYNFMKGNPGLKPENSTTFEVSVGKKDEKISESVTFFKSEIANLIEWKYFTDGVSLTNTPVNITRASITGFEAKVDFKPADFLAVYARYTYLRAVDQDHKQLPYRPEGTVEGGINIKFPFETKLTVNGQYIDSRKYIDPLDELEKTLKPYYLFNCSVSHKISKNFKVAVDVTNLLDNTTYETKRYYSMPGRVFNAEIQVSF